MPTVPAPEPTEKSPRRKRSAEVEEKARGAIQNRVVGHADVAPDQLLANPLNFRRHPGEQLDALRGSLKIGWLKAVLVNRTTGHVVDGHARVEEALRQGLATVPVDYVDLTLEEEKLALAILDPITGMAYHDSATLMSLLSDVQQVQAAHDEGLAPLLNSLLVQAQTTAAEAELAALKMAPVGMGADQAPTDPRAEQFWVWAKCTDEAQQDAIIAKFGINPGKSRELDATRILGVQG